MPQLYQHVDANVIKEERDRKRKNKKVKEKKSKLRRDT